MKKWNKNPCRLKLPHHENKKIYLGVPKLLSYLLRTPLLTLVFSKPDIIRHNKNQKKSQTGCQYLSLLFKASMLLESNY